MRTRLWGKESAAMGVITGAALEKTNGNYLVIFALPTILHQDERYYAKGEGNFLTRGIYAASRILITPLIITGMRLSTRPKYSAARSLRESRRRTIRSPIEHP